MSEKLIFKPLKKLPKEKPFAVWDVETKPAYKGEPLNTAWLGAGIYDGYSDPAVYTDEAEFFRALLGPAYAGFWIYAHNASGFDFHYLKRFLCRNKIPFTAFRTGQRHFISTCGREFYDSMAVLRGSLAAVGESLGLEVKKWDVDPLFYEQIESRPWQPYLCDDLRSLFEAIQVTRESFTKMGAVLRPTLASTAMCLFRAKYLDCEIECLPAWASEPDLWRKAYLGGRTEVFKTSMGRGASWDVNSSYPYSMIDPAGVPTDYCGEYPCENIPDTPSICEATVEIPNDERHPPLGIIGKDRRLYFATGKRRGWFTSVELAYCRNKYGSASVQIHRAHIFTCRPLFNSYVADLYEIKKKAGKGSLYEAAKVGLNGLYGKFGQRREREKIVCGENWHDWPWNNPEAMKRFGARDEVPHKKVISQEDYIFAIPDVANYAPYILPQIAATVTARSRILLQGFLDKAGDKTVYCDTDSIYAELPPDFFPSTKALGGLKVESKIEHGIFPAPKVYYYVEQETGKAKGKAKGVRYKDAAEVLRFINGDAVKVKRMLGLFEVHRRDHIMVGGKQKKIKKGEPTSEWAEKRARVLATRRNPNGDAYSLWEMRKLGFLDGYTGPAEKFRSAGAAYRQIVPDSHLKDFSSADARYREWKATGKNRPRPWAGGELDPFKKEIDSYQARRLTCLLEAWEKYIGRSRSWLDDRVKRGINMLYETVGRFALPNDVQAVYNQELAELERDQ